MSGPSEWAAKQALRLIRGTAQDLDITGYHVAICSPCLDGEGGECHTPGCLFWMCSAPNIPIRDRAEDSDGYHIAEALDEARLAIAPNPRRPTVADTPEVAAAREALAEYEAASPGRPRIVSGGPLALHLRAVLAMLDAEAGSS